MSIASVFKNLGHAIASGAKHFEEYAQDALNFLGKVKGAEPAIAVVAAAVAPQAASYVDLGFHVLGDVVNALEKAQSAGQQVEAAASANGINVVLDQATIAAIKDAADAIKAVLSARGAAVPAAQ